MERRFASQKASNMEFDVFFDVSQKFSKNNWVAGARFEMPYNSCDLTVMVKIPSIKIPTEW